MDMARAWDSTAINAGQCPAVDQPQFFGHGSTVTGTLAGNGLATGAYMGVAPMADMVMISSDFDLPELARFRGRCGEVHSR